MTRPIPNDRIDDPEELRKRWLLRFLKIQARYDTKIRTVLIQGAEDAYSELIRLNSNATFSAAVRTAQIRLMMREVSSVLKDTFGELLPVIKNGQKEEAQQAVIAFGATDLEYLRRAFGETGAAADFIEGQRRQAALHVANAVSRITRSEIPLSGRVYRTRALSTRWVQQQVTSGILRGDSAVQIAKQVRSSIRPTAPGGVSYAALRLGRTELNNAFHATSIALSQDRPWVEGMLWNLSAVHEYEPQRVPEICEQYSGQIFEVNNVPRKPHPQCRCYVTPALEPFDVFIRHLTAGQYRDWMKSAA